MSSIREIPLAQWRSTRLERPAVPVITFDFSQVDSAIYFAAAALLIFVAALLASKKAQRKLKPKTVAVVIGVSAATLVLIFLLLSALNRKAPEPRNLPPDYPAPTAAP